MHAREAGAEGGLTAPMPGKVIALLAEPGLEPLAVAAGYVDAGKGVADAVAARVRGELQQGKKR